MSTLRVLFATSEYSPFIKTGGLADVSSALPRALAACDCEVAIVLPAFPAVTQALGTTQCLMKLTLHGLAVRILRARYDNLVFYLIDCESLFAREGGPYGEPSGRDYHDNALRFAVFGAAIERLVEFGARVGCRADVLHLNDWPTALAAGFVRDLNPRPRVVFTIHNFAHQGLFPEADFRRLWLPHAWWSPDAVEFHGRLSFLKAGLVFSDAITTVSPGYAAEIQQQDQGYGLDGLMRHLSAKLTGIVNGIDTTLWDPAADPHLATPFDHDCLQRKALNKRALRQELGLDSETQVPLLGFIGRLADQKGLDLIAGIVDSLQTIPADLVLLGQGESCYEQLLQAACERYPNRVRFLNCFDERIAHRIEAAADVFLMPSRFEPCGLTQMYSMRYGTIPLVRRTGGLADTVRQVWNSDVGDGTGFLFDDCTPDALLGTLRSALTLYSQPEVWRRIQINGMREDFSWQRSAQQYLALFQRLVETPVR